MRTTLWKRGGTILAVAIRALWWGAVAWLVLLALGLAYMLGYWLVSAGHPHRHEALVGSYFLIYYSWPALLVLLLACAIPRTGLSPGRRLFGVGLLATILGVGVIITLMPL